MLGRQELNFRSLIFSVESLKDFEYGRYVEKYYELPIGESIEISINPGGGWTVDLIKK